MRFRKPFTAHQRRDAVREYESFRRHVRLLQTAFPPTNAQEREVLSRYRRHVRAIGSELLRVDARIDVEELNAQIELAKTVIAEYYRLRQLRD